MRANKVCLTLCYLYGSVVWYANGNVVEYGYMVLQFDMVIWQCNMVWLYGIIIC